MNNHGSLVISLDFEMMWGCIEWGTPQGYGQTNIRSVKTVVHNLVKLFEKYNVHATFATVGLLLNANKQESMTYLPQVTPSYTDTKLNPYPLIQKIDSKDEALFFAPDLVAFLLTQKHIELGSHTYSHYYCWADGQTLQQFEADLESMNQRCRASGCLAIHSIVFPKNQINHSYLTLCKKYGIKVYRGNAQSFFAKPKHKIQLITQKLLRFLDSYYNISGYSSYKIEEINLNEDPINIRASRFLRPFNPKFVFLEKYKLKRIKREILHAAKHNEIYHLWWHPHNFGANMTKNLHQCEEILQYYQWCHEKYGMKSYTMSELVEQLKSI